MAVFDRKVEETVQELARRVAGELGYEVLEVRFGRLGRRAMVRIVLDKADGNVGVDDCARFSRTLDHLLEETDPIPEPYNLEVSSPGIDRPFDSLERYRRNVGNRIDVWLQQPLEDRGKTRLVGVLEAVDETTLTLRLDEEQELRIPMAGIRKASRTVEF